MKDLSATFIDRGQTSMKKENEKVIELDSECVEKGSQQKSMKKTNEITSRQMGKGDKKCEERIEKKKKERQFSKETTIFEADIPLRRNISPACIQSKK